MPIRSLPLWTLAAVASLVLVSSIASAAAPLAPTLTPDATSATISQGGTATFRVEVRNTAPAQQSVTFASLSSNPANWTWDAEPLNLTLEGNAAQNVTLNITAPAAAQPGSYTLRYQASDQLGTSDVMALSITVTQAPAAPPPTTTAPKLTFAIGASNASAGTSADGALSIKNDQGAPYTVALTASSKDKWPVTFDQPQFRLTQTAKLVGAHAAIPADAAPGTVESITITATVTDSNDKQFVFTTTWDVTALAASSSSDGGSAPGGTPAGDSTGTTSASSTTSGGSTTTSASTTSPTPHETFSLTATVIPDPVQIAPGETARAYVRITNTGTAPLHLQLAGSAADNWPLVFEPRTLDLGTGVTRDVAMTLAAPQGIFPGGTGSGSVMVQADNGLLRTVPFKLSIQPPTTPRDESKASTAVVQPPAASGPTFSVSPTTATLAAGAAAVGIGALVLVRARGAREKLLWIGVGLYTRLLKPDVLGHPERDRLYKIIETQPGVHFHALQRELQWNTGTLTYHLRVLEKHGFIVDRRDGAYRRFYLQGAAPRKELFSQDAPQGLRADVLEAVRNQHGISQGDLALALGANKQTVNYHVKALERQGTIRVEKRGRETFLYPTNAPGLGPNEAPA